MRLSREDFWQHAVLTVALAAGAGAVTVAGQVGAGTPGATAGQSTGPVKLSEHVYVIPQGGPGARSNVGFIVGNKATLVIDSGLGPRNGQIILGELAKVSSNTILYVTATHFHPEHVLGESGFPASAIVFRSRAAQKDIDEKGAAVLEFFRKTPANAEALVGAAYRPADILFDGDVALDLGGVQVDVMFLGPAHTHGDTGFSVKSEGVVFTGDVAMSTPLGIDPAARFTSAPPKARTWLASLERLAALAPIHVVPSHGPLGDRSMIEKHRVFMKALQDRVRDLKRQGKPSDEAVQVLKTEFEPKYPAGPTVIPNAVMLFYGELP